MDKKVFLKRFSVGLVLDTTVQEYKEFLGQYGKYIDNVYFSLPLGDKFHARRLVAEQLRDNDKISLFWQLLTVTQTHGIKLEVVFNTEGLTRSDIFAGKILLDQNGINVQLIGALDKYYDIIQETFPNREYVFSFNNHISSLIEYQCVKNSYSEFVLGRQNIRNLEMFDYIKNNKHSKVVLLLNNGCSHLCGGCKTLAHCHSSYYKAFHDCTDAEYIYALQSIFPFEIHEKLLDTSNVDLFKISSRNSDIAYLSRCIQSYIFGDEIAAIEQDKKAYYLWGRLAWHEEFYCDFDYYRLRQIKNEIYSSKPIEIKEKELLGVSIEIECGNLLEWNDSFESFIEKILKSYSYKYPYKITDFFLSFSQDELTESVMLAKNLIRFISSAQDKNYKVYAVIPAYPKLKNCEIVSLFQQANFDGLVVNDENTLKEIRAFSDIPLALGMGFGIHQAKSNEYWTGNPMGYGEELLSLNVRQIHDENDCIFALCEMTAKGVQISHNETIRIKAYISNDCGVGHRIKFSPEMIKTIVEQRLSLVYKYLPEATNQSAGEK